MKPTRAWVLLPSGLRASISWRPICAPEPIAISPSGSPVPIDGPATRPGITRSPWRSKA